MRTTGRLEYSPRRSSPHSPHHSSSSTTLLLPPYKIPFLFKTPSTPFPSLRLRITQISPLTTPPLMALKAVHVSEIRNLDHVPETPSVSLCSTRLPELNKVGAGFKIPKFLVAGHRGHGMNVLHSPDQRFKVFKENSIRSFNAAARSPIDFIEFDVQVTRDNCPVIFHDNFIVSEENGTIFEKRVTELLISEFLSYGPQKEGDKTGKTLLRKTKDGKILSWNVETDDSLCTLKDAFQLVEPTLGFNIELKFDDHVVYQSDYLTHVLQSILQVVFEYGNDRPIIFSSFQPDAALLVRKLQSAYPVFFLTNGGSEIFCDVRRNSLEEAIKLCLEGGLHGIVSEVKGVFRNPGAVTMIKEAKLSLLTYGKLNNVPEAVYMQHLMGIDGVIVDLVKEITDAVSDLLKPSNVGSEEGLIDEAKTKPQFSQKELSFLLKLIPELIQQH